MSGGICKRVGSNQFEPGNVAPHSWRSEIGLTAANNNESPPLPGPQDNSTGLVLPPVVVSNCPAQSSEVPQGALQLAQLIN